VRWQPSLLDADELTSDRRVCRRDPAPPRTRRHGPTTPEWAAAGSDTLFEELLERCDWQQPEVHMYERTLVQPRLSAGWPSVPELEALRDVMLALLGARYDRKFDSVG